jgi:hypothetical protein
MLPAKRSSPNRRQPGTTRRTKLGNTRSVKAVDNAIKRFAADWNANARPFRWVATADEIIDKVRAVTSRMARLLGATEIGHVIPRAA